MTPHFVISDNICRSNGGAVAVAVPLLGFADLVEIVLADEVADRAVAYAQERGGFLQAAACRRQGFVDVLLGDLIEVPGQTEPRREGRAGFLLLDVGRDDLLG